MWVSDKFHTSTTSPSRNRPSVLTEGEDVGLESPSGYFEEEINRLVLSGVESQFLGSAARSEVTILTTPSWLSDINTCNANKTSGMFFINPSGV
jgi:hypothetical protein